ncbi:transposase domain-containing protein [Bradyrhizobium zhanjiangense]|uniref:transposase domain-containing protein n=1 Tax=Bradyrhizobium zhanjiangense TaxID=1325107 RepID=UPI001008A45F|nr:transposase domain-containing protein [Bradyrhizobium zhanjiangense]
MAVERACNNSNKLFAGSDAATNLGSHRNAAANNGNNVDPCAKIQILQQLANGLPNNEIDALMPWTNAV